MSPQVEQVEFPDEAPSSALVRRIAGVLAEGGLVALPTETVYGLAARADSEEALEKLARVKGRGPEPFTWHVGSRRVLAGFDAPRRVIERLAERYWPGPLTLVLSGPPADCGRLARDGWCGVRLPAHEGTATLLEALDFPVALTSANTSGAQPLLEPGAIATAFAGQLELVLDGGPSRLGEASAVLRVGRGRFELLREGLVGLEDLRRTAGLRIAFVCTGNTCRSPMAEGLARKLLAEALETPLDGTGAFGLEAFGFELSSAGVAAFPGAPASAHAVSLLEEEGVDLGSHASSPAIAAEIAGLDRVYCLTRHHREALVAMLPPGRAEHVEVLDPAGGDVIDPIGGDREEYARCAALIRSHLEERIRDWV